MLDKVLHILYLRKSSSISGNHYLVQVLSSWRHVHAFPSFVFVFQRGVRVRSSRSEWSVETKRKHLEWTRRGRPITGRYLTCRTWTRAASRPLSPLWKWPALRFVGEAPRCEGAGNVECPAWSIGPWEAEQGHEAQMDVRATSVPPPGRVLSAQRCHTHWMRKGHSLHRLRKHACFCLSCKRKFGSLSSGAFAFHKAQRVPVECDHMYTVCGIMHWTRQCRIRVKLLELLLIKTHWILFWGRGQPFGLGSKNQKSYSLTGCICVSDAQSFVVIVGN